MESGQDIATLYRNRFEEASLGRKRDIWRALCRHFLQRFVHPGDTVLDIACGYGEFINAIQARHKIAVDINADAKRFLAPDVDFRLQPATTVGALGEGVADVIFCSNFLEHLPDKPALDDLLGQIARVLKPGGRLLILGPNLRYLPGRYWDFYDHSLGLTHLSLCEALELQGYAVDACIDRFLPYTTKTALPTHPLLVRLYLLFPPAWRLLGRQFFIVASPKKAGGATTQEAGATCA